MKPIRYTVRKHALNDIALKGIEVKDDIALKTLQWYYIKGYCTKKLQWYCNDIAIILH